MKTSIISSLTYQNHITGPGHPERIDRVKVINEELKKLDKKIEWFQPKSFDQIESAMLIGWGSFTRF